MNKTQSFFKNNHTEIWLILLFSAMTTLLFYILLTIFFLIFGKSSSEFYNGPATILSKNITESYVKKEVRSYGRFATINETLVPNLYEFKLDTPINKNNSSTYNMNPNFYFQKNVGDSINVTIFENTQQGLFSKSYTYTIKTKDN